MLKNTPLREADMLYTLYTKEFGLTRVAGRSIRKGKLLSGMSLFSLARIGFIQGKSYNTLTETLPLFSFPESRKSLGKLSLFYRLSETVLSLIHGEERQEDVFHLIVKVMKDIERRSFRTEELSLMHTYFSFRLLEKLGYRPKTDGCVLCKGQGREYFSPKDGGTVCASCAKPPECVFLGSSSEIESFFEDTARFALKQDCHLFYRILKDYLLFIPETQK